MNEKLRCIVCNKKATKRMVGDNGVVFAYMCDDCQPSLTSEVKKGLAQQGISFVDKTKTKQRRTNKA